MSRAAARRALLVLALGAAPGCAHRGTRPVDPQLPEAATEVPEAAPRAILEEAAGHLDPTPRALALGWLIRLEPTPGAGEYASRALYDPSAWVQRAGVLALADHLQVAEARQALEEYVAADGADPYTRATAGLRLATVGSPAAAEALSQAWRAETEPWVIAPLALAAAAHGDAEALEACARALSTGEIGLEMDFLAEVGASGHPELQAALREGAAWVEEELALAYATAQVQLGDPSGEQALRKALQHGDPTVRMGAIDLLLDLDLPSAVALLSKARSDGVPLVRWYARLALAARSQADPDLFDKAYAEPDPEVRELAVRLAARSATSPSTPPRRKAARATERLVERALADPEPAVRLAAVRAAADLDLRGSRELVAGLTTDPWLHLRVEAAGTALALGDGAP